MTYSTSGLRKRAWDGFLKRSDFGPPIPVSQSLAIVTPEPLRPEDIANDADDSKQVSMVTLTLGRMESIERDVRKNAMWFPTYLGEMEVLFLARRCPSVANTGLSGNFLRACFDIGHTLIDLGNRFRPIAGHSWTAWLKLLEVHSGILEKVQGGDEAQLKLLLDAHFDDVERLILAGYDFDLVAPYFTSGKCRTVDEAITVLDAGISADMLPSTTLGSRMGEAT